MSLGCVSVDELAITGVITENYSEVGTKWQLQCNLKMGAVITLQLL